MAAVWSPISTAQVQNEQELQKKLDDARAQLDKSAFFVKLWVAESHRRDYQRFGISWDNFHTTHSEENAQLISEIFLALSKNGFIETKKKAVLEA